MAMLSNLVRCFRYHQLGDWIKDCPFSAGTNGRGGLVSSDVLEKDTNTSTTNTVALLNSDKRSIWRNEPRHLVNNCQSAVGINGRGEGLVSSVTSDIIEKESETMSTSSNMDLFWNSNQCLIGSQLGHLAKDCPSSSSSNAEGGEGPTSTTHSEDDSNFMLEDDFHSTFEDDFHSTFEDDFNSTSTMTMLPNQDKCLKCLQQGHCAIECPSSNGNGGEAVSSATCEIFEKDVNSTNSCISMPSKSEKCYKCQQLGHWAKDCPSSNGNNVGGGEAVSSATCEIFEKDVNSTYSCIFMPSKLDKCFKCEQAGHWAKDCLSSNGNNVGEGEAVSSATCQNFKKDVDSTSSYICMPSKSDKCFTCQQPGHWAKDCPSMVSNSKGGENSSSGYNIPEKICICGRGPCVIRTSNTAKNPGRKFYKCPFRECGYFEWCDGPTSPSKDHNTPERLGRQQFTSPTYTDGGCKGIVKGYDLSTRCYCRAGPCPVRTAKTQKNMGRQFVCCPVRKGEGTCGFFKWCDELDSAVISSSSLTSMQDDSLERNVT